MEKVSIYKYYSFGFNYNSLRFSESNQTAEKLFKNVKEYIDFITELGLKVTRESLIMMGFNKKFIVLEKLSNNKTKKNVIVPTELFKEIKTIINKADTTLDAELNIRIAFILDEKRFSNEILIEQVQKIFSKGTFYLLPTIARYDFEESCKCLAFDRFTATAFHALRGTEDTIKFFYENLTGKKASDTQTWYYFVNAINKDIKAGKLLPPPDEELMLNLDNLRKYYRNKTQHPQLTYSSDDAQDLLTHCTKCVNQIIKDLISRSLI